MVLTHVRHLGGNVAGRLPGLWRRTRQLRRARRRRSVHRATRRLWPRRPPTCGLGVLAVAVIGICGSYGGLNVGDEAILTAMLSCLRAAGVDHELVVCSRDPDHTIANQPVDRAVATRDLSRDEVVPEIERLDLFLLGGGGLLYDGEARAYLRDVRLAQERGIPTFAYAVGVGPLQYPEDRQLICEVVSAMTGVSVRDEGAKRVLEEVGVERDIIVTADPALLLSPAPFDHEMLAAEGIGDATRLVGFSVREPGSAAPDLDEDAYHALLAHAADFVVYRFNADVVFVPLERGDIRHSHAVIGAMRAADRAHVLRREYGPREVLGLMDRFDLVVGMRLHSLVFAAVANVPFLPLPYAGKVAEFVAALGVAAPAAPDRESAGPLLAAIDHVWDHRDEERGRLAEPAHALREQAERTADLALSLLDTAQSEVSA
ncbi:MAG: polysaccharide pyruvyl transferase [Nitriliruptorales bacterium]|nr:polysaccharide pyruvyl transferase [Nitriliruptorales bacterium]